VTIELHPGGIACNLRCSYCYQNPMRDREGNARPRADLQPMLDRALDVARRMSATSVGLFGGEALLLRDEEVERIAAWAAENRLDLGLQTNAALLTPARVELLDRLGVRSPGVSMDGPGELNDARWAGSLASTRAATRRSEAMLDLMLERGFRVELHVVLSRVNAAPGERLERLAAWVEALGERGLTGLNAHLLELDDRAAAIALTDDDTVEAVWRLAHLRGVRSKMYDEMVALLRGKGETGCVWNACDPMVTQAVQAVYPDGSLRNCGRVNKAGYNSPKPDVPTTRLRQRALWATGQDAGGCRDCRFFAACKGHCPGSAEGGDWRRRTSHCAVLMALFERIEAEMTAAGERPWTLDAEQRDAMVGALLEDRHVGGVKYEAGHDDSPHSDWHLDSNVAERPLSGVLEVVAG